MRFLIRVLFISVLTLLISPDALWARGVAAGEYFWDTDPGQGNGTALLAADGNFGSAVEEVIQGGINLPAIGVHTFNIRVKADNGAWGPTFKTVIDVQAAATSLRTIKVNTAEYFFDADPGQGSGTALLAFDGAFDKSFEAINQSGINLPAIGTHTFSIRAQDASGAWGPAFNTVIDIQASSTTLRDIKITAAEYFFDTDPGNGNGSLLLALDGNFNSAFEDLTQSGINLPAIGVHKFSIRAKDASNTWGPAFTTVIEILASSTTLRPISVTAAEYFFDTDPGQGSGSVLLALDGNFNSALEQVTQSGINLPAVGVHKFNLRAKDASNSWGPVFTTVIDVLPSSTTLRTIKVSSAEYFFDTDPGEGNGTAMLALDGNFNDAFEQVRGGNIPTPVVSGVHVLSMRVKDGANLWGPKFSVVVNMDTTINSSNTHVSGPSILCSNSLAGNVYSTPLTTGNTYTWAITGGNVTAGTGTNSVTVTWSSTGPYKIKVTECLSGGTPCTSDSLVPTINAVVTSSLSQTICQGQSYGGHITSGTYTDTLISGAANGCDSIRTVVLTVTPSVTPSVTISSNPAGPICTGTSVTFTATPTNGGASPTYQWTVNGSNAGTGATLTRSNLTNNDVVQVVSTSNAVCPSPATATASVTMTVNTRPVPAVTFSYNPNGISCQGTNITFTAAPTNGGSTPTYNWFVNGAFVATGVSYSNNALQNGDQVYVKLISSATCATPDTVVSSTVTMSLTGLVVPSVTISANPSGTVCQNTSVTFTANPTNGGASPTYQWYVNGVATTTGATLTRSNLNNGDSVRVTMTSNASCASLATVSSPTTIMSVTAGSAASVTIAASPAGAICAGTSVTFTATPSNGGSSPTYQWYVNGVATTTGPTLTRSNLNNNDSVRVVLTSSSACASTLTASSNTITLSVTGTIAAAVTITANPSGAVCAGTSVTYAANPTGGGTTPTYVWTLNGAQVSTSATYTSSSLANGDAIRVTMTSSSACASPTTATANTTANISAGVTPTVSITASPSGSICAGTNVTFTSTITNGGAAPTYQWKVNGANVSTNANFSSTSLSNNDTVTVTLTSNATCVSVASVTSNKIVQAVTASVTPSVVISANPAGQVCPGTSVTFTATPTNGGTTPTYQWLVNGANAGTGATLTRSNLNNGDSVRAVLTSNATCATATVVSSNTLNMSISGSITPSVTITSNPSGALCAGSSVTFTANPSGGGTTPTYQWTVNSVNAGNGSTLTRNNLANGDTVRIVLTSNSACAVTPTATAFRVVTVNAVPRSTVTQTICAGRSYAGHNTNGTFVDTLVGASASGCDSIRTLNLTVLPAPTSTINQTICAGQSYGGHTTTGSYSDTLFAGASNGCDSIRILVLTVTPLTQFAINQTICAGGSFGGHNTAGTYVDTIHVTGGCDSVRTLTLAVLPQISFSRNVSICNGDSYFAGGTNQTTAGTYTDTLVAGNGCDSVVTTVLTLKPSPAKPTITQNSFTLSTDTAGIATYQWYKGNTAIQGATGNQYVATSNGYYHISVGSANGCSTASDSILIQGVGIGETSALAGITLFPNPTDSKVTISLPAITASQSYTLEVLSLLGERVLAPTQANNKTVELDLQTLSQGMYLVRVTIGSATWTGKVVKTN